MNDEKNVFGFEAAATWSWVAVMLLLCCVSDTALVVVPVIHAVGFAYIFLSRDLTDARKILRREKMAVCEAAAQKTYAQELAAAAKPEILKYVTYRIEGANIVTPEIPIAQKPKMSEQAEQNWQSGFFSGVGTIELDPFVTTPLSERLAKSDAAFDFEFEV